MNLGALEFADSALSAGGFGARFLAYRGFNRCCSFGRCSFGLCGLGSLGLRGGHFAVQYGAILDHDAASLHVACEFTRAPDVHALAGLQGANDFAANHDLTRFDLRADASVGADCESAAGKANEALELAI